MERYFILRSKDNPDVCGTVIQLKEGNLETFAGEFSIAPFNLSVGEDGEIYAKGYSIEEINMKQAKEKREDFLNFIDFIPSSGRNPNPDNFTYYNQGATD